MIQSYGEAVKNENLKSWLFSLRHFAGLFFCAAQIPFKGALCKEQALHEQRRKQQRDDYFKNFIHLALPCPPRQAQPIEQCPQLPPQMGDFPFFLSFTMFITIAHTTQVSTMQTIIVPMFAPNHDSISILLSAFESKFFYLVLIASFLFLTVSLVASL